DLLAGAKGNRKKRGEAVPRRRFAPYDESGVEGDVGTQTWRTRSTGTTHWTLPAFRVRPYRLHLRHIAAARSGLSDRLNRFGIVMAGRAHPDQRVAADLSNHFTDALQQIALVLRPNERLIAAGDHSQCS